MTQNSIPAADEAWDEEDAALDPSNIKVVDDALEAALDKAAGTQLISIRMNKSMVDAFKAIAAANKGIGYQTLIKQILQRFIEGEMKRVWNDHLAEQAASRKRQVAEKAPPKGKARKAA